MRRGIADCDFVVDSSLIVFDNRECLQMCSSRVRKAWKEMGRTTILFDLVCMVGYLRGPATDERALACFNILAQDMHNR
jgi:hypothetical protein